MTDPEDDHPLRCTWHNSNPPECSCWHEEVRTISRLRPDPGPDPNAKTEAVDLPCDQDMNEAS